MMGRYSISILIGAIALVFLVYWSTFQVSFNEVAIKVTLGRADEDSVVRDPGLKTKWPWPVVWIQKYDTRMRVLDTPETEIKTRDGKQVIIGAYAIWTIADPLQFFVKARFETEAENQMRSRIATAKAALVGKSDLSDFVNLDVAHVEAKHAELLTNLREQVAPGLLADYGIAVHEIGIRRISLPKETTQQVFESMRQERNKLATELREEGKSEAAGIVARATQEADQVLAFAQRKAEEIRSAGTQAVTRIYSRIEQEDREFFEWLRWMDALKAALAQKTTIFIDEQSPLFAPFVHPPVAQPGNSESSGG
jgi:membrane protease subunit HflC